MTDRKHGNLSEKYIYTANFKYFNKFKTTGIDEIYFYNVCSSF